MRRRLLLVERGRDSDYVGLGIRNFTVSVTVRIASEEANLRRERAYLNKLNLALVQVRDRNFFPFSFDAIYEPGLCRL